MKSILMRALGILAGVLFLAISAAALYVAATWDRVWDAPMPDLHASRDPAVINRGEYLAFGPAHCVECHLSSTEEYDKALDSGTRPALVGGMKFAAPPLGVIYSRNITPDIETGIGRYTDGQLARMLRYAVRPDGHASVQLLMPYGDMADADIVAVISYLRAQRAVSHVVPANEWTTIGKVVKSFAPVFKPRSNVNAGATSPTQTRERGEYLARNVANCVACHTERDLVCAGAAGIRGRERNGTDGSNGRGQGRVVPDAEPHAVLGQRAQQVSRPRDVHRALSAWRTPVSRLTDAVGKFREDERAGSRCPV